MKQPRLVLTLLMPERTTLFCRTPRSMPPKSLVPVEVASAAEMEVHFEGERVAQIVTCFESLSRTQTLESDGGIIERHDGREVINPLAQALQEETGEVVITGFE